MRRKDFAERHSIDPENEEHLDIQDCEIPRDEKNMLKSIRNLNHISSSHIQEILGPSLQGTDVACKTKYHVPPYLCCHDKFIPGIFVGCSARSLEINLIS